MEPLPGDARGPDRTGGVPVAVYLLRKLAGGIRDPGHAGAVIQPDARFPHGVLQQIFHRGAGHPGGGRYAAYWGDFLPGIFHDRSRPAEDARRVRSDAGVELAPGAYRICNPAAYPLRYPGIPEENEGGLCRGPCPGLQPEFLCAGTTHRDENRAVVHPGICREPEVPGDQREAPGCLVENSLVQFLFLSHCRDRHLHSYWFGGLVRGVAEYLQPADGKHGDHFRVYTPDRDAFPAAPPDR